MGPRYTRHTYQKTLKSRKQPLNCYPSRLPTCVSITKLRYLMVITPPTARNLNTFDGCSRGGLGSSSLPSVHCIQDAAKRPSGCPSEAPKTAPGKPRCPNWQMYSF